MATVTGLTAARMLVIEAMSVVAGVIQGDNLILTRRDGTSINAGNVRGAKGDPGPPGDITVSPAGGALSGNYPNPGLADNAVTTAKLAGNAVTDAKVAAANKDGAAGTPSLRTLGSAATQAAAGSHTHGGLADTGWQPFNPTLGETPFAGAAVVSYADYRKVGPLVHVRFRKDLGSSIDRSSNVSGDFPDVTVFGINSLPESARPSQVAVHGVGRILDTPTTLVLTPSGSVIWVGGTPRSYAAGSPMFGDFVFFTDN